MKCEKKGCNNERTCFHYCHEHHQKICMAGIVSHTKFVAAQQDVQSDGDWWTCQYCDFSSNESGIETCQLCDRPRR